MNNDQNYMCLESDCVYNFLCSNGYMFKLCYKLIANSVHKFNVYFTDIPVNNIYTLMRNNYVSI